MSASPIYSTFLSLLSCAVPPYALRLNRLFGTGRVGWVLFVVFTLLSIVQVLRTWQPMGIGLEPGLTLDLVNFLVPMLLLTGMVHIEILFKERLRLDQEEKRLRGVLQQQVKDRTAELDQTNEELQREISLRKQGEEELRSSKERYRFLFEENPQPMWIYDLKSLKMLAFNAAAVRHYGYTAAEFRELSIKGLCLPQEVDAFVAEVEKTGGTVHLRNVWHLCRKDGTILEVEIARLDLTYAGTPARLILAHDVTAQRLLQKQLLHTQRMEVTTQLAGGVADRFTTLVSVLEGDAEALVRQSSNEATAEPLKRIAATAGCAAELTRQLLALVGRHPIQVKPVDLNQLVENLSGRLARLLGARIQVEKVLWAGLPMIVADATLVEQMLQHLALNAREAMTNGGTLTLATTVVRVDRTQAAESEYARAGSFVCLTVSDTGCGMTPEVRARLFEPFFTTKANRGANGLGLATVHGLVKQHAGWMEIKSEPNAGTQVAIHFPCGASPGSGRRETEFVSSEAPAA
jgi:PAS domain S-box-containing protein